SRGPRRCCRPGPPGRSGGAAAPHTAPAAQADRRRPGRRTRPPPGLPAPVGTGDFAEPRAPWPGAPPVQRAAGPFGAAPSPA
ncbi:Transposase zinc-ribbon domain-containing protein, partial [Dysosmobacter welbionis]